MNTQYRKNLKAVLEASKTYCDESIDNLKWELGTYDLDTDSDTTTAYQKVVPSGSIEAKINTLGGMSYKSENLAVLQDVAQTTLPSGIIYKVENGTIIITGTSTSESTIELRIDFSPVSMNGSYTFKCFNNTIISKTIYLINNAGNTYNQALNMSGSQNPSSTFTLSTGSLYRIVIYIASNEECNYVIKPMLVSGSTEPTEFKRGFDGIRDIAPTSVESVGFNIWDEEWELGGIDTNTGLNETDNNRIRSKNYIPVLPNSTYYYKLNGQIFFYDENQTSIGAYNVGVFSIDNTTFTTPSNAKYVRFRVLGVTYNNDICINISNVSLNGTYKSYFTASLLIPAQVQALDGYGWGVNDTCYNYIDFNSKKFIKKVGRVDLGSLDWSVINDGIMNSSIINNMITGLQTGLPNIMCANYTTDTDSNVFSKTTDKTITIQYTQKKIFIYDSAYTDATAFKTAMSGVYLYYELATPVETDISAYLTTNKITVEGGGSLTMENTYGASVPSDVDYLIEEVKA